METKPFRERDGPIYYMGKLPEAALAPIIGINLTAIKGRDRVVLDVRVDFQCYGTFSRMPTVTTIEPPSAKYCGC